MLFSIFDVLERFEALRMLFYKFLLKWGKNEKNFESSISFEVQKYYFVLNRGFIFFFSNGYIRNVVSTLSNFVKIDVESDTWFRRCLTLLNSTLKSNTVFNVVNFSVDVHNVVSTLIWRCEMLRHYINRKSTLNQR